MAFLVHHFLPHTVLNTFAPFPNDDVAECRVISIAACQQPIFIINMCILQCFSCLNEYRTAFFQIFIEDLKDLLTTMRGSYVPIMLLPSSRASTCLSPWLSPLFTFATQNTNQVPNKKIPTLLDIIHLSMPPSYFRQLQESRQGVLAPGNGSRNYVGTSIWFLRQWGTHSLPYHHSSSQTTHPSRVVQGLYLCTPC